MKTILILLLMAGASQAGTFNGSQTIRVEWFGGAAAQELHYDFSIDVAGRFDLRKWEVWSIDSQPFPSRPTWWLEPLTAQLTDTNDRHWRDLLDVVDNSGQANFLKLQVQYEDTEAGRRLVRFVERAHQDGDQLMANVVLNPIQDYIQWYNFGAVYIRIPEPSCLAMALIGFVPVALFWSAYLIARRWRW